MKFKLILLFFIIPHFIYSQKGSFCIDMQVHNIKKGEGQRALILENSTWAMNYNTNKWVFYVTFLDGSYRNKELVKEFAKEWEKYGNIQFVFVNNESVKYAHIRVSFNKKISWSYIGIQSTRMKGQNEPSMMLGWNNETKLIEIKRLVLHEFGHALGLLHSHNTEKKPFQWNKDYVYSYLGTYVGWGIGEINDNIFAIYNNDINLTSNSKPYDKNSIMSYFIPKEFTLNGYTSPVNYVLSANDKLTIAEMYPFKDDLTKKTKFHFENKKLISNKNDKLSKINKGELHYTADTNDKLISPIKYDEWDYYRNYIIAKFKGKYGVLDKDYKTVIPFIYQKIYDIGCCSNHYECSPIYFISKHSNNWYIITINNQKLNIPFMGSLGIEIDYTKNCDFILKFKFHNYYMSTFSLSKQELPYLLEIEMLKRQIDILLKISKEKNISCTNVKFNFLKKYNNYTNKYTNYKPKPPKLKTINGLKNIKQGLLNCLINTNLSMSEKEVVDEISKINTDLYRNFHLE